MRCARILAATVLVQGCIVLPAVADNFGQPSASAAAPIIEGYTCCNLHYEGNWISDANWKALPFVAAGARIKVQEFGRYRAKVLIDNQLMRIGLDYGRELETREQYVAKLVVKADPNLRIATFDQDIQAAIKASKVKLGMTKEQVIIALGYPRTDLTPSLDSPEWNYEIQDGDKFVVLWGQDQRVKDVEGTRQVKAQCMYGQ